MRSRSGSIVGIDSEDIPACDHREKEEALAQAKHIASDVFVDFDQAVVKPVKVKNARRNVLKRSIFSCTVLCCGKQTLLQCSFCHLLITLVTLFIVLIFGVFSITPVRTIRRSIQPLSTAHPSAIADNTTRVLLYGDSQWGIIERLHHLTDKIKAYLPEYPMDFTVVGDLGVRAYNLNDRLHNYLHIRPNVVLINLDSDVSNVNEDKCTDAEKQKIRELYRGNVSQVVEKWMATGAIVALGGPGLLGEGPMRPFNIPRFTNKEIMLNAYVDINKQVARQYGIAYFDVRYELKKALPWYRLYYNGYVTRDGEHPNERGTLIEAEVVSNLLLRMYEGRQSWPTITTPSNSTASTPGDAPSPPHGSNRSETLESDKGML